MTADESDRDANEWGDSFAGLVAALDGNFELLAVRLEAGANLDALERQELARLLRGQHYTSVIKRRDGRRGNKKHFDERMRMGARVHLLKLEGLSEPEAFKAVDLELRHGRAERLKTVREAYAEFKKVYGCDEWATYCAGDLLRT